MILCSRSPKTPAYVDGYCEDCGKEIVRSNQNDAISFFDSQRCAKCEAAMFEAMEDQELALMD